MTLTYVTAFMKIYEVGDDEQVNGRNLEARLNYVKPLLATQIPLVIFISPCYLDAVLALCPNRPKTEFVPMELTETHTWRLLQPFQSKIPAHRNTAKDTFEFLTLMNAKAEFVAMAANSNVFSADHFAWVDFSIFHVLKNAPVSQRKLELLCNTVLAKEHPFVVPGCWRKGHSAVDKDNIHWRFCGGLFMGTKAACIEFFELHKKYLPKTFNGCTWEVNYWTYIEWMESDFSFSWYKADHNDSILDIPNEMFEVKPQKPALWLTDKAIRSGAYPYPSLDPYVPTSSSYLEFQGQQLLNVRYVNYKQTPEGLYIIYDPTLYLKTENFLLRLKGYEECEKADLMRISTTLEPTGELIQGLEDVRLYELNGSVKFIATQCQWSPSKQSRIILGSVDLEANVFKDLQILEPPSPTCCEKNWIPIIRGTEEQFIYQWYPFQVGRLNENHLEIIQTYPTPQIFERVRGSTLFYETEEGLLGVVHYSEERKPRHYYHMLVLLNKETLQPLSVSDPFVFGRHGIEFCIGFAIRESDLQFWYSQHDRDPVWLVIPKAEIPMRPI